MPLRADAGLRGNRHAAALVAALMLCVLSSTDCARSQEGAAPSATEAPSTSFAPQPPPQTPQVDAAPPSSRPGLLDKLGDWLRDSAEGMSTGLKDTQQRIQEINKGTMDALTSIPVAGIASGRALCPRAANGAPDCYAAAEQLCKDKGYSGGRSLDSESAQTCNPRVYLPGYQRKEGDCRLENFVTRAACQ